MTYTLTSDGLLAVFAGTDARAVVKQLRKLGFHYGHGEAGLGLYSPTWDRQLGYFSGDVFYLNPSLLHHLTDCTEVAA